MDTYTYELTPTSTVYMDGTAEYHVKRKGLPGIVATIRVAMGDFETLRGLFALQGAISYEQGRQDASEAAAAQALLEVSGL
jgi:hypothetical protein